MPAAPGTLVPVAPGASVGILEQVMDIGACVIGSGQMGRVHAEAWQSHPGARVLSVFDTVPTLCEELAATLGATAHASCEEAIRHPGVAAVSICTPTCDHRPVACLAARHGRHVLCEKPLAATVADADAMIDAAREAGVLLSTSFQVRDFPKNVALKRLFDTGVFGGPVFARIGQLAEVRPKTAMHRRSMNNGPVLDMAPHHVDLMRFLTGREPVQVFATGHVFARGKERVAGVADLAIDAAQIQVRYDGGHVLSMLLVWGMPERFPSCADEWFVGPAAAVRVGGNEAELIVGDRAEPFENARGGSTPRIHDLAEAIAGRGTLRVTGEDGRIATAVSVAALESIETGQAVDVLCHAGPAR